MKVYQILLDNMISQIKKNIYEKSNLCHRIFRLGGFAGAKEIGAIKHNELYQCSASNASLLFLKCHSGLTGRSDSTRRLASRIFLLLK